jgi:hypothetical protein
LKNTQNWDAQERWNGTTHLCKSSEAIDGILISDTLLSGVRDKVQTTGVTTALLLQAKNYLKMFSLLNGMYVHCSKSEEPEVLVEN